MRQKKVKMLRKYILDNMEDLLIIIRNDLGEKTENMSGRALYQYTKKLYHEGRIEI